jgi:hypothetical protein
MIPPLGSQYPETRHLNLKWSVADTDRIIAMAQRGNTARQIATAMNCKEEDVVRFGDQNGVFIRRMMRGAS